MISKDMISKDVTSKDTASTLPLPSSQSHFDFLVSRDGLPTLGPGACELMRLLDAKFRKAAVLTGAEEKQFPALIGKRTLDITGYFQSFPHYASAVSGPGREGEYFLSPAVCYHCYQFLAESAVQGETVITCCGKCFRADSISNGHLWEFTMREIVFLGPASVVQEHRQNWMRKVACWARALGLDAELALANDPFFGAQTRGKKLLQQIKELKYELTVPGPAGIPMPVASFNLHEELFAEKFNIRLEIGLPLHSGCVAFGLERWYLALTARHGINRALELVEGLQ
jgi:seryl-tRNA synthetase